MKIGNWLINDKGISWDGKNKRKYFISVEELQSYAGRDEVYDWLVHLPSKDWITETDMYALNSAFIYLISLHGMDFHKSAFIKTLEQQQQLLENG